MTSPIPLDSLPRRSTRRRVISGSMMHREIEVLDWRLHELDAVVDDSVIVESVLTHSGVARQIVRPDRDPRFAWAAGRLHCTVIDDPPPGPNPWLREWGQREAVWSRGAARLDPADDDLVVISDLDEVPFPEAVDRLAWSEFEEPHFIRPHQKAIAEGVDGIRRRRASGGEMFGTRTKAASPPRLPAHAHRLA